MQMTSNGVMIGRMSLKSVYGPPWQTTYSIASMYQQLLEIVMSTSSWKKVLSSPLEHQPDIKLFPCSLKVVGDLRLKNWADVQLPLKSLEVSES